MNLLHVKCDDIYTNQNSVAVSKKDKKTHILFF